MRGPRCCSHTTLLPFSPSSISHRTIHIGMEETQIPDRTTHTSATHTSMDTMYNLFFSLSYTHTQTCTHEHHKHLFTPHTHDINIAIHQHTYTFTQKNMQSHSHTHIHAYMRKHTHTHMEGVSPSTLIPSIIIFTPYPPHSQDPTCEWVPGALASSGLLARLSSLPMSPCPGCGDAGRTTWAEGLTSF